MSEPLTHSQQRVLLAELLQPGTADNLMVHVYLAPARLDPSALAEAVHRVVARHPSLRDRLGWLDDGTPVSCAGVDDVELTTVRDPGHGTVAEIAGRVTADWWTTPFDLERDAPFRMRLARLPDGRDALCLGWHHMRCDGWSARLVAGDLARAYQDVLSGRPTRWVPLPGDYARREQDGLAERIAADAPFWRALLEHAPAPLFAVEHDYVARHDSVLPLPTGALAGFDRLRRRDRLAVLLHVVATTLRGLAGGDGRDGVLLTTISSGRADPEFRGVVGCFVNPVIVPSVPGGTIGATRDLVDRCLRHSRLPFDEVVPLLPERSRATPMEVVVSLNDWSRFGPRWGSHVIVNAPRTAEGLVLDATSEAPGDWTLRARYGVGTPAAAIGPAAVERVAEALSGAFADL